MMKGKNKPHPWTKDSERMVRFTIEAGSAEVLKAVRNGFKKLEKKRKHDS